MKMDTILKRFKIGLIYLALLSIVYLYYTYYIRVLIYKHILTHKESAFKNISEGNYSVSIENNNMKYILQWTSKSRPPFYHMGEGNSAFIENKCKYTNCYVTDDRNYFPNETDFDAIAFNGMDVSGISPAQIPKLRSTKQKYVFGAMESADNFPLCAQYLDGFFNWTWTYRLDSDIRWEYIKIFDMNKTLVGPKINMEWPAEMKPLNEELKEKLSNKTKAVAWFVSHCVTKGKREAYVKKLKKNLSKFGWTVDIYGKCGNLECPRKDEKCKDLLERNYYFYLSFENSFAEDYVTEKLLNALNNNVVPIVYGAADYTRYLPNGSYLDAMILGPTKLATEINDIIKNKTRYYDYFRWKNHFVYEQADKPSVCNLCEWLNNEEKFNEFSVWNNFRTWWNGARYKINCASFKDSATN
ncbi:unnamed protein product [Leptidea sinapis]|uniref:Fucosyltransferase n=2 Tax=Leptidea sinapis TaxID=189913 RepID=A0A5E4R3H0_9NEOP|nr:unnamed protein product [Leptidea sinapis]